MLLIVALWQHHLTPQQVQTGFPDSYCKNWLQSWGSQSQLFLAVSSPGSITSAMEDRLSGNSLTMAAQFLD